MARQVGNAPTSRPLQGHANLFQLLPDLKSIDKSKESNLFGTESPAPLPRPAH
jgi:hypothetical protein